MDRFTTDETVHWYKLHPDAKGPAQQTGGAVGYDLATIEDVRVAQGEIKLVGTGLVIEAPRNHVLYITGRSSTPRRHGVMVITGIVDEDYCGPEDEIRLQVMGIRPGVSEIPKGIRIAQALFMPVTRPFFNFSVFPPDRPSRGGFGSTG